MDPLLHRAHAAADWLRERRSAGTTVTVVHHVDADGVSAGAIALRCLERAGIASRSVCAKSLDEVHLDALRTGGHEALWFCDFGSTAYMEFPETPRLVCDHHELVRDGTEEDFPHVNPLLDGLPGDSVSGAGCTYLVAEALDVTNRDLLPVALVGAAGDLQDRAGFTGTNARLLQEGIAAGLLSVERDIGWYGIEGRSVERLLMGARDPSIPGVTGDRRGTHEILAGAGAPPDVPWSLLPSDTRLEIRSRIVERLLDTGTDASTIDGVLRDIVRIAAEAPGTPLRELREFATLLNGTARYGRPEVGLAVAAGDRQDALHEALGLLEGHRKHLASAVQAVASVGVRDLEALQWVHLADRVHDTVVGTVCGMALDGLGLRRDVPLLGFAHTPDGRTKVSSRAPSEIQGRIDLAFAMRESAAEVGGQGGGHKGAAGATIPRGSEDRFLQHCHGILCHQLGVHVASPTTAIALPSTAIASPTTMPIPGADQERVVDARGPRQAAPAPRRTLRGQSTLF